MLMLATFSGSMSGRGWRLLLESVFDVRSRSLLIGTVNYKQRLVVAAK
jgi:hypothetical protein